MVNTIVHAFNNKFSTDDLTLTLPKVFKDIETAEDSEQLETVTSNTVQPLNLIYQHNIVGKPDRIAYIF